jgi:hypothetical protein
MTANDRALLQVGEVEKRLLELLLGFNKKIKINSSVWLCSSSPRPQPNRITNTHCYCVCPTCTKPNVSCIPFLIMSNKVEQITNAELANELSNKGFYVNKISRGNTEIEIDYLVVSVSPPKDVEPIDHNAN